ncbi:MAG TPA: stage II sporulation protein M [Tenericutes bacterium]|nr:stage II sporulation protein M [Mycoplasmatota bacterium]
MKKALDKLKSLFSCNKNILIFVFVISLIGIIFGALFNILINESDKKLVVEQINEYINNISTNKLNYLDSFKSALISNLIYYTLIWILGISIIGVPLVVMMAFLKNFIIGFSIGSFILTYNIKGALLSIVYIFPHYVINVILLIYLTVFSIMFSFKLIGSIMTKNSINFRSSMKKYSYILLATIIIILFTTIMEVFITPNILKLMSFLTK